MRCEKHGLATADDGLCVLCRRESRSQPPARSVAPGEVAVTGESSWVGPNLLLLAMVVVVMAAFLGSRAIAGLGITTPAFHLHAAGEQSSEDEALPDEEDPLESVADAADRAALARVEINLYYAPWCPACRAARAWFRARNVPYTGFNVDRDPGAARRLRELSPSGTIPTIEIDGKVVVGFDERQITAVLRTAIAERKKEL